MLEPLPDHQEMAGHAPEAAEKYCMDITFHENSRKPTKKVCDENERKKEKKTTAA